MSGDSGERMAEVRRADFSMPEMIGVEIRETRYEPAPLRNFARSIQSEGDAVEFIVKTDKPIPIRALGPALYVGDTVVTEVTQIASNTYRFVAPTRKALKRGAPIHLGWTGQLPNLSVRSAFEYQLQDQ
jgi:hypothetical protein